MTTSSATLKEVWVEDAQGIAMNAQQSPTSAAGLAPSPQPSPTSYLTSSASATPYGVSLEQLEALSAMAYLVGSPFQREQPSGNDTTHPALLVAAKLLQQGVDPERIIQLVACRHGDSSSN
ncbi:hypothetical protein ABL78_5689 [Leptomonas seymouri]|uniref:Uncharacterized protein n=1 Tax=Leptomonas seymouri TaxID=5684 RepID=A0A0N0P4F5_LEPSE|nr:hypothetical protein ABL78_5689 [Leptomonas seymouri]|eukprot:KPI85236.1 hypothetical protein ABL78_5689 [Leptomonas seymouri]